MAAAERGSFTVDVTNLASIAAIETALAAAVAAQPAGFFPERVTHQSAVLNGARKDLLIFTTGKAPFQDWIAVTAAVVLLVQLEGLATPAAIDAAIDAIATTQEAGGNTLRVQLGCTLEIGGATRDVVVLLFTDGAPATT